MTKISIDAFLDGEPVQIVRRNVYSPAIVDGVLTIDDFGVRVGDVNIDENGVTLTLKLRRN